MRLYVFMYICVVVRILPYDKRKQPFVYTYLITCNLMANVLKSTPENQVIMKPMEHVMTINKHLFA